MSWVGDDLSLVFLWQMRPAFEADGHKGGVSCLLIHPEDLIVFSGSLDRTIKAPRTALHHTSPASQHTHRSFGNFLLTVFRLDVSTSASTGLYDLWHARIRGGRSGM